MFEKINGFNRTAYGIEPLVITYSREVGAGRIEIQYQDGNYTTKTYGSLPLRDAIQALGKFLHEALEREQKAKTISPDVI
jgi:hypothetical protein